jgi:hypothetical protein
MKPPITEHIQYTLYNLENYNPLIKNSSQEILTKFIEVIIEYMRLIAEKINIKNKSYYIFIFERGIETLIHIFSIIFYYTKNLELTFYHSQKAYYFYVEFIEQISDDNITFLQLSSRDALMFVYKKTIFELNNDRKKICPPLTPDEHSIVSYTDANMHIYKKLVSFILLHNDFKYENKLNYINMCCDKIQQIAATINKCKIKKHLNNCKEDCIYEFVNFLTNKQSEISSIDLFFDMLKEFIERLKQKKKMINKKIIINKLYEFNINNNFVSETRLDTLIDHIFTD